MTTKISNSEKILIVLKEIDDTVGTEDLALFTHINIKNIGRYLQNLENKKYISRKRIQDGKKRYIMNKILAKGKNTKFTTTYDELKKHLHDKFIESEIETITTDMEREIAESNKEIEKDTELASENRLVIVGKETVKAELLSLIKILAIRDQDAKKIGLRNKQELTNKIISLILKL